MIAELFKVIKSSIRRKNGFPGDSVISNAQGFFRNTNDAEMFALPGVMVVPPTGSSLVFIPVGGNRKAGVCIAGHNYQIGLQLSQGETAVYSTTEDGKTVKSLIKLDKDGNIEMNGNTKRLVTYAELNTQLQLMVSAINAAFATKLDGGGTAGTVTLNISTAETQTIKTGG